LGVRELGGPSQEAQNRRGTRFSRCQMMPGKGKAKKRPCGCGCGILFAGPKNKKFLRPTHRWRHRDKGRREAHKRLMGLVSRVEELIGEIRGREK